MESINIAIFYLIISFNVWTAIVIPGIFLAIKGKSISNKLGFFIITAFLCFLSPELIEEILVIWQVISGLQLPREVMHPPIIVNKAMITIMYIIICFLISNIAKLKSK